MGSVQSVASPKNVEVNPSYTVNLGSEELKPCPKNVEVNPSYTVNLGSEELKPCEKCNSDSVDSVYCDQCKQTLCSKCCQHHAERNKINPYYGKELIFESVQQISVYSKYWDRSPYYVKLRSITVAEDGKLASIGQAFFKFTYRTYNATRSKWIFRFEQNTREWDSSVGDLCYSEVKKMIYVTIPREQKVYKTATSHSACSGTPAYMCVEAFKTPLGDCFGITPFDKGLALSVKIATDFNLAAWQIHFIDFNGIIKQRIQNDANGKAMFANPRFLTSNRDGTILFVFDLVKNAIVALNANGNILFEHTDELLKSPTGIAVDCYNNIYMACGKKLIQMDSTSKTAREILTVKNKNAIMSVCFDYNARVLWTVQECGTVTSFYFQDDKH